MLSNRDITVQLGGVETRKVACLGWYGHGNFGDELILEGLRQLFKDWQMEVYSSDNRGAYPLIDFEEVNNCDLFVLGGGELINKRFLWMPYPCSFIVHPRLYRLYAHTFLAQKSWISEVKTRKVILGCGVDVDNASQLEANVRWDLEDFSYIGLRDKTAVEILQSVPQLKDKVHFFPDLAYAINADYFALKFLAHVFPCRLHGLILAHMWGSLSPPNPYHRKVQRVYDTIKDYTPTELQRLQENEFKEMLRGQQTDYTDILLRDGCI